MITHWLLGINNHMGSALTQKVVPMAWTMEVLRDRDLFFVDSRTTQNTQAQNMAKLFGIDNAARQVFLDNIPSEKHMMFRLMQLIKIAKQSGQGIAIAHPYPETIRIFYLTPSKNYKKKESNLCPFQN